MRRFNRERVEDIDSSYTIRYNFMYPGISKLKNYKDYINEFRNFTLAKRYEDELINEGYYSYSYISFFLRHGNDFVVLFSIELEIDNETPRYIYHFDVYENNNVTNGNFNDFINKYKNSQEKIYLDISMRSKFYRNISSHSVYNGEVQIEDILENEDEDEDDEIPPVESSFPSEQCVICYSEKPNILNFPCLHISQCEACNEKGKFIKCIICKDEIQYKIKI